MPDLTSFQLLLRLTARADWVSRGSGARGLPHVARGVGLALDALHDAIAKGEEPHDYSR
jgi:hypothetical protein